MTKNLLKNLTAATVIILTVGVGNVAAGEISNPNNLPPCQGSDAIEWVNCFITITYGNGNTYRGEIKYGSMSGVGTMIYANGDKYSGQFSDNTIQGQGKFVFAIGGGYIGEWKYNKPHGKGIETYTDGRQPSEGFFENGKFVKAEKLLLK
jgi:hypothetical protein